MTPPLSTPRIRTRGTSFSRLFVKNKREKIPHLLLTLKVPDFDIRNDDTRKMVRRDGWRKSRADDGEETPRTTVDRSRSRRDTTGREASIYPCKMTPVPSLSCRLIRIAPAGATRTTDDRTNYSLASPPQYCRISRAPGCCILPPRPPLSSGTIIYNIHGAEEGGGRGEAASEWCLPDGNVIMARRARRAGVDFLVRQLFRVWGVRVIFARVGHFL